ncbi:MutS2 family protein [Sulfobacillus acidophilus TPY]|uniref:Endonuclease MutS2 n=1 Tax=Sulfobacillus acidophilus (strain ATCC 700253 / DSM 10332 / NAL) TaxID=679936 RepID=G8TWJ7_SULAD|nr:MutS2 family protein [Sulfobacillus acidophilus TPY]AEW04895.1 MutS2 protein [Sulfobacillus acidophilus DSM 10332]
MQADDLAILEWPKIVERVQAECDTPMGVLRMSALDLKKPDALSDHQAALREVVRWVQELLPTAGGALPVGDSGQRAARGGVLTIPELTAIQKTIRVYQSIWTALDQRSGYARLSAAILPIEPPRALLAHLDRVLDAEGRVQDHASPALAHIRGRMRDLEREILQLFDRILHAPDWAPYLQEPLVTVRFGRRVIPVRHEYRNQVPGVVQDFSSSGQTVYVEPLAALERQNRLSGLMQEEAEEIERILAELSREVAGVANELSAIQTRIGWFDELVGIARYGLKTQSVIPQIGGDRLHLIGACHPLLTQPVPIQVDLTRDRPVLIISGPNTGGKTVALKTVGLIAVMGLTGLMVPAHEDSTIPWFRAIWADVGDQQSLEHNLSTFSGHLARLAPMMEDAGEDTLCLIDEIGAGTDPEEGAALAEAMIRHLAQSRAYSVISTHFNRLKLLAYKDDRIQNARVEFDPETLAPTYRLILGEPGSSYAFYIARRLGFPPALLDAAEALLPDEAVALTRALEEVNQLHHRVAEEEARLRAERALLAEAQAAFEQEQARWLEKWERDRSRAEATWRQQLDQLTRRFNDLMQEYRQSEAENRVRALEAIRQELRTAGQIPAPIRRARRTTPAAPLAVGQSVRVTGFADVGQVVEMNGNTATVQIGALRMKLAVSELEPAGDTALTPTRSRRTAALVRQKAEQAVIEVDLRGMTQAEALETLDKFLDDAVLSGAPFVRIIHGKGTGVLRRAVQHALKADPRVESYRLGEAGEGGDGVTVATLK